jgi:hypothetical protein
MTKKSIKIASKTKKNNEEKEFFKYLIEKEIMFLEANIVYHFLDEFSFHLLNLDSEDLKKPKMLTFNFTIYTGNNQNEKRDLKLYYDFIDGIRFEYSFNDVLVFRTNDEENEGNIEYINDNIKLLKTYPAGQDFINSVIEKIESIMSKSEEEE